MHSNQFGVRVGKSVSDGSWVSGFAEADVGSEK
jgi:hypothetical protein